MKTKLPFGATAGVVLIVALIALVFILPKSFEDSVILYEEGEESFFIKPFVTSEGYVAIIPSYWDLNKLQAQKDGKKSEVNLVFDSPVQAHITVWGEQVHLYKSKVASMMINTTGKSIKQLNKSKDCEDTGDILVAESDGTICYYGGLESIHGRGNSTWGAAKKPYNVKLTTKSSLLGMKPMKSYCLLANSFDHSNMRNYIAYKTALDFGTASPVDCEYVSFYLNGEYLGLYLLTTKPNINKNSINIRDLEKDTKTINSGKNFKIWEEGFEKGAIKGSLSADIGAMKGVSNWNNPEDISGGYLIEVTGHMSTFNEKPSGFISAHNIPVSIREPEYATKEQVEYISSFFDEVENAVRATDGINGQTGYHFSEYLDIESFVKYYLIQDAFLTLGPGLGSFKMYKDSNEDINSKLVAGPIWDFDNSMSNADIDFMQIPDILYAWQGIANHPSNYKGLLAELMNHQEAISKAKILYTGSLEPLLHDWFMGGRYDSLVSEIEHDAHLNEMRWPIVKGRRFDEEIGLIKGFMTKRIESLSAFYNSGDDYLDHCVFIDAGFTDCSGTYNTFTFYSQEGLFIPPSLTTYYGSNKPYRMDGVKYKGRDEYYTPNVISKPTQLEYLWKKQ